MSKKGGDNSKGMMRAALIESRAAERDARNAAYADRPDTFTPFGKTEWTQQLVTDPGSGKQVTKWVQTNTLNDEYQALLDQNREMASGQIDYRTGVQDRWGAGPTYSGQFGSTGTTIGAGDWQQFGQTAPTTGVNDYLKHGVPQQTIGANDYRQFGTTNPTLGADDYRQFGTTDPTIGRGTYDERFGQAGDHGYGDHGMEGGQWDFVGETPEYIRQQARDSYYQQQVAQMDPQWDRKQADLELQLRNQGFVPGDAGYQRQMDAFNTAKANAYEQTRLGSLEASRMEAAMNWDQLMAASQQKNMAHQADIDNIYRARQSNIDNYLSGRQQDQQGYLNYQQAAWDQEHQNRLMQLQADLDYGQAAYDQDYRSRQQQLEADLGYGSQAFQQDYMTKNLLMNQQLAYQGQAWDQDFNQRQANIANNLRYGDTAFNQDLAARQQQIDAMLQGEQIDVNKYQAVDPMATQASMAQTYGAA